MFKRLAALLPAIALLLSACGAGGGTKTANAGRESGDLLREADLSFELTEKQYPYTLSAPGDEKPVSLNGGEKTAFFDAIAPLTLPFPYEEEYGTQALFDRLLSYSAPTEHTGSITADGGRLTKESLLASVKANNAAYLAAPRESGISLTSLTEPDDELLGRLCALICETVEAYLARFPDIDRERVYCNLGNLKIFLTKDVSLSLASVDKHMVLHLRENTLSLAGALRGRYGIRNTLIHEITHLLQLACLCELKEPLDFRCGLCWLYTDCGLNALNWKWLCEGSAEKETSLLTGDDPLTYEGMIGYIESLNYATFLDPGLPAYYAETLSFGADPERLFSLFGCETREDRVEIAKLMFAVEIMQQTPKDFSKRVQEKTGLDLSDDSVQEELCYRMKPPVCLRFAKTFYRALANEIERGNVTERDLYALLRVYEGLTDAHLGLWENRTPEINEPFYTLYKQIRAAFFKALLDSGSDVSEERYLAFGFFEKENAINAPLAFLPKEKQTFFFDRVSSLETRRQLYEPTGIR